jgi:hypothetical protein
MLVNAFFVKGAVLAGATLEGSGITACSVTSNL